LRTATLLVNVTNDAWFRKSSARYQHLQISRMRSMEAAGPPSGRQRRRVGDNRHTGEIIVRLRI
jgi:hypothetical protein